MPFELSVGVCRPPPCVASVYVVASFVCRLPVKSKNVEVTIPFGTLTEAELAKHHESADDAGVAPAAALPLGKKLTSAEPPAATLESVGQLPTMLPASSTSCIVGRYALAAAEPSKDTCASFSSSSTDAGSVSPCGALPIAGTRIVMSG